MPTIIKYQAVVWCSEDGEIDVCRDLTKYPRHLEEIYEEEVPESVAEVWLGDENRADDHDTDDYRIITVYYNEETGECT
jgi:hypothetical protein